MSFVPHTDEDRRAMLQALGLSRLEDLFDGVPERARFPSLDLPPAVSEQEIERELGELADGNHHLAPGASFLGAGVYRHYVPATVEHVLRHGGFFTAYTPYQPELSQGMLQAGFEYQSMICALTGMDVSTASHYQGATALAEAVLMALAVGGRERRKVVVSAGVHAQYREVLRTYLQGSDAELVGDEELQPDASHLAARLDGDVAACVIQSPNFLGHFEPVAELARAVHASGGLLIVVADPIALGRFRPPGHDGADIVVAEGQPLGLPPSFGGPHLGIFATKREHVRRTPGRLVGETVDTAGRRGYVLTLSTREQHIRRERATSNICTNAALMALAAAVYLATLGKSGLRKVAELCYHKSHYAAEQIGRLPGLEVNPRAARLPFFKEFSVALPLPADEVNRRLLDELDISGGYPLDRQLLVAVTEMNTRADIDRLVDGLARVTR